MEPEGSLPCSQQPASGPYPEPDVRSILVLFSQPRLRPLILLLYLVTLRYNLFL
jgi:hypothetical protein